MPRQKRIKKVKTRVAAKAKAKAKAKQNKQAQIEKQNFQNSRVSNMIRDAERYALVEFVNTPEKIMFSLINMKLNKHRKVFVKQKQISCNCFDFKIRCKRAGVFCKHVCYVLDRILKLPYTIIKNLKISKFKQFTDAFVRIKFNQQKKQEFKKELTAEDNCVICFTDFMDDEKTNIIFCNNCNGVIHKDCTQLWIANAVVPGCPYCKDKNITLKCH